MTVRSCHLVTILAIGFGVAAACGTEAPPERSARAAGDRLPLLLEHHPLSEGDVPVGADAVFDPEVSQDGGGSLRAVTGQRGGRLRLYRLDDLGSLQGRLTYTGFLRSQDLDGTAYLELWCHPPEGNPAFARGVQSRVAGTSDWRPQEVSFRDPKTCSNPTVVELNVLIHGAGTVWIDDIRLWDVPVE